MTDWLPSQADRRSGYDRRVGQPDRRKARTPEDRRFGERRES